MLMQTNFFFFSSRRRHTRLQGDWSSDVCSSYLMIRLSMPDIVTHRYLCPADEAAYGSANVRLCAVQFRRLERRPGRNQAGLRLPETHAIADRGGSNRGARVLDRRPG